MIHVIRWFLHGEDAGARLLLALLAASSYVTGAGWRPHDPGWVAGGCGAVLAALASRPRTEMVERDRLDP